MKNIFKIILIIFALAISFLVKPQSFLQEQISTNLQIQTIKKDNLFLVSNNKFNEEISNQHNGNNSNTNGLTAIILPTFLTNNIFEIKQTPIIWCLFCNLTNYFINGKYIRAP